MILIILILVTTRKEKGATENNENGQKWSGAIHSISGDYAPFQSTVNHLTISSAWVKSPLNAMSNETGKFGDYVKLVKTGAFVKVKSHDPKNEVLEIESNGVVSTVPRSGVERTTPDDELKVERLRNPNLPPNSQ